ncbi:MULTISPECIES: hypothetical protein [unclassified Pseudoalteromonas]|uniref:hypothetical protein n=1 Tax=unclassified Pseudoalteromonas TaxID=194690 RepID=UPI0006931D49|nr:MULTISPECIES: hypothetical protein [unclassified Pseudoalteromonas]
MLAIDNSAKKLPANLSSTAKKIRSQFQQLQSVKQWHKAQPKGEDLDISAWLDFQMQSKQGPAPQKGLYRSFKSNRDLSCLLFGEALEAVGDECVYVWVFICETSSC